MRGNNIVLSIRKYVQGVASFGLLALAAAAFAGTPAEAKKAAQGSMDMAQAKQRMAENSRKFMANAGQWDPRAKFVARTGNVNVWLDNDGITYD